MLFPGRRKENVYYGWMWTSATWYWVFCTKVLLPQSMLFNSQLVLTCLYIILFFMTCSEHYLVDVTWVDDRTLSVLWSRRSWNTTFLTLCTEEKGWNCDDVREKIDVGFYLLTTSFYSIFLFLFLIIFPSLFCHRHLTSHFIFFSFLPALTVPSIT